MLLKMTYRASKSSIRNFVFCKKAPKCHTNMVIVKFTAHTVMIYCINFILGFYTSVMLHKP